MHRVRRIMLLVLVVLACAGCDQATKTAAKALLPPQGTRTMLHNTITLVYTENPGAFLSLGATWPVAVRFTLFTVAAGLLLLQLMLRFSSQPRLKRRVGTMESQARREHLWRPITAEPATSDGELCLTYFRRLNIGGQDWREFFAVVEPVTPQVTQSSEFVHIIAPLRLGSQRQHAPPWKCRVRAI